MMPRTQLISIACACVLWVSACVENAPITDSQSLDFEYYRCEVQPVLLQGCAFGLCHADPGRPFRLAHPSLMRYDSTGQPLGSAIRPVAKRGLSAHETELNYRAAMAMAMPNEGYTEPLLIAKPLNEELGGAYHEGREIFGGGDVFNDADELGLQVLRKWIRGETGDITCD